MRRRTCDHACSAFCLPSREVRALEPTLRGLPEWIGLMGSEGSPMAAGLRPAFAPPRPPERISNLVAFLRRHPNHEASFRERLVTGEYIVAKGVRFSLLEMQAALDQWNSVADCLDNM